LVEKKMFEKNKDYPFCRFECFEHAIFFWCVFNFEHINFAINKNIPIFFITVQTIMHFPSDISNIQNCNFKECPLTWVVPLIVFLPQNKQNFKIPLPHVNKV
jgi:hypothetical protein